ncbi:2'-5' RNA ligase family protein [Streptomyces sp. NPDC056672]|uniref:2'-5' RNA ligase family protein n=1 Tax=Streptomyces sp. NPDC056672 TaxID=3345906 RepID=UPI0036B58B8E
MTPELDVDHRVFPAAPPPDLDDPGCIVEHDWRAFAGIDRMTDHWSRPGWPPGRRAYYWMLTFPSDSALSNCARHCQNELVHLGMDPVPDDGLHVTLQSIGNTAQVSPLQIKHLVRLAEQLSLRPFQLAAHPLTGSRGALRFSLSPWRPLVNLHAALGEIGRQAGVSGGKSVAAFRPHLGVQYNNRDRPAGPVIASVARLRLLPPVILDITAVELVELHQVHGSAQAYRWNSVGTIPFRPTSS